MTLKIMYVGQFLGRRAGGAEKSTLDLIKKQLAQRKNITILRADSSVFPNDCQFESISKLENIQILNFSTGSFGRFPFIRYILLKLKFRKLRIDFQEFDEIIVYDFWGRALINKWFLKLRSIRIVHYIRCEMDLGVYENYNPGLRRLLWLIYSLIQFPFNKYYGADFQKTLDIASVNIANSNYMRNLVREKYGVTTEVNTPQVDVSNVKLLPCLERKKIVFIGDNNLKGLAVVRSLAKLNPDMTFKLVVRSSNLHKFKFKLANEEFLEWSDDLNNLYADCRVLVVPSQCNEAYGRVAREGYLLGLEILCSNLGGLPEAVDYNPDYLINDYSNVIAWNAALRRKFAK